MDAPRRALRTAICCTVAMIMFGITLLLLAPGLSDSFGAHRGHGVGVNYTFTNYQCVGGNSQYRNCRWLGTVYIPEDAFNSAITAKNVVYQDVPPRNASAGLTVEALWSNRDPKSAYALSASNAWLNTLASAIISVVLFLLFLFLTVYWWRRVAHERRAAAEAASPAQQKSKPKPSKKVDEPVS